MFYFENMFLKGNCPDLDVFKNKTHTGNSKILKKKIKHNVSISQLLVPNSRKIENLIICYKCSLCSASPALLKTVKSFVAV